MKLHKKSGPNVGKLGSGQCRTFEFLHIILGKPCVHKARFFTLGYCLGVVLKVPLTCFSMTIPVLQSELHEGKPCHGWYGTIQGPAPSFDLNPTQNLWEKEEHWFHAWPPRSTLMPELLWLNDHKFLQPLTMLLFCYNRKLGKTPY